MKNKLSRRLLPLFLALLMFALSACGGGLNTETATKEPATAQTGASTGDEPASPEYSIDQTYTRAMLDAIPVANASMTSDELRAICLEYERMQLTIPWISSESFSYILDNGMKLSFDKGTTYGGLPYTGAGSSLYVFMDYVDEATGLLDASITKRVSVLLGNHCCASVYWAWSRVSSSITFTHTQVVVPSKGVIPLGPYTFDPSIDSYKNLTTETICKNNGEQTMYESYAKLLLADGIVVNNQGDPNSKGNHVRMVAELPHVERNADGTIDGKNSYVICVEQDEVLRPYTLENGLELVCEGHVDSKYTFAQLFEKGYLPFTIQEFLDPSAVQKAEAHLSADVGASLTTRELSGLSVEANYALAKLVIKVTEENGNVLDFSGPVTGVANFTTDMGPRVATMERQLKKGSYEIEIGALVGTGETVPVYSGTLVKE